MSVWCVCVLCVCGVCVCVLCVCVCVCVLCVCVCVCVCVVCVCVSVCVCVLRYRDVVKKIYNIKNVCFVVFTLAKNSATETIKLSFIVLHC